MAKGHVVATPGGSVLMEAAALTGPSKTGPLAEIVKNANNSDHSVRLSRSFVHAHTKQTQK